MGWNLCSGSIVWALAGSALVASYTQEHEKKLSDLQHAACQLVPQGISIALGIRELVRQAYLFPALVLMRPLIERAAVLSYLCEHPEAVVLWREGWNHGNRPSLKTMLDSMSGSKVDVSEAKAVCDAHNHIVHGDPIGSYSNLIHREDGTVGYASSKMLHNPGMADAIAAEALCYLLILNARVAEAFPDVDLPTM